MPNKALLTATLKYRLETLPEVLNFHEELKRSPYHEVTSFTYTVKPLKEGKEIVGEYYVVTAKVKIGEEKEPSYDLDLAYVTEGDIK